MMKNLKDLTLNLRGYSFKSFFNEPPIDQISKFFLLLKDLKNFKGLFIDITDGINLDAFHLAAQKVFGDNS